MSRLERVTLDPAVCRGQPTITRLGYTVESLLELLAAGVTMDEVLADYPGLEHDDLVAALEFAALAVGRRRVVPLPRREESEIGSESSPARVLPGTDRFD